MPPLLWRPCSGKTRLWRVPLRWLPPMQPDRFRALCTACGWTPQAVALRVGRSRNMGTEWATGRVRVPADVAAWLERVAAALANLPPPVI